MLLHPRGGAAHGDPLLNPTATTYDALPPSSTYKGPKVAGTYEGFVGVFTGVGLFVLITVGVAIFLRWRTLRRRTATQDYSDQHAYKSNEAFEMPSTWNQHRGSWPNESTVSLSPEIAGRDQFYSVPDGESRSQEVFFDGKRDSYLTRANQENDTDPKWREEADGSRRV